MQRSSFQEQEKRNRAVLLFYSAKYRQRIKTTVFDLSTAAYIWMDAVDTPGKTFLQIRKYRKRYFEELFSVKYRLQHVNPSSLDIDFWLRRAKGSAVQRHLLRLKVCNKNRNGDKISLSPFSYKLFTNYQHGLSAILYFLLSSELVPEPLPVPLEIESLMVVSASIFLNL